MSEALLRAIADLEARLRMLERLEMPTVSVGGAGAPAIAFYGGTPRTRAAALTAQLTTITYTDPKTPDYAIRDFVDVAGDGTQGYAFASRDEANSLLAVIANLQTRVQQLENALNAATGVNLIA